jgi:hypothetical protein
MITNLIRLSVAVVFAFVGVPLAAVLLFSFPGAVHAASSTTSTGISPALPSQLLPYASIIGVILVFIDGLIFGVAVKKAITSAILIVVGLIIAGFAGVAIPFLTTSNMETHLTNILISQARHIGPIFYTLPLFWIVGFALGIWKG